MKKLTVIAGFALLLAPVSVNSQQAGAASSAASVNFDSKAKIAYLLDMQSGAILIDKNSDQRIPPASMAKMMTVYVAFDQIAKGKLSLDQKITVQPETWQKWNNQGSTMFLRSGESVTVEDLLHGIVTLSGNDASVVLADGISGSEKAFTDLMNVTAKNIGMKNSNFGTSNGWPDEGVTYVTARDLGILGSRTIYDFPKLYTEFYGLTEFSWNGIKQSNRNPLLGKIDGADGLKTGHTEEAGYGFTGTAEQNGRRLMLVVAGLDSFNGRINESIKAMNWGFKAWATKPLYKKGETVGEISVQLGSDSSVDLVAPRDIGITMPAAFDGPFKTYIRYKSPIKAPFAKGDHIADLVVKPTYGPEQIMALSAADSVEEAGFFGRVWNGIKSIFGV